MWCHGTWCEVMQWDGMFCGFDVLRSVVRTCAAMQCACLIWWLGRLCYDCEPRKPMTAKPLKSPFQCAVRHTRTAESSRHAATTPYYKVLLRPTSKNAQQLRQTCLLPVQREHSLVSTAMEWWQSCVVLATHERCSPFRGATCGLQNTMQADICLSCLWSRARQEGFSALFWSPCRHKRWQVCWKGVIFGHPWHTEGEWRWNVGPFSPRFFLDHPTVHFLMPWRWQHEFQNGFFLVHAKHGRCRSVTYWCGVFS